MTSRQPPGDLHCPVCDPEKRWWNCHSGDCPEGVPHRVGFFQGVPVVADLPDNPDMAMVKSDPLFEPNQWHVTTAALEMLRERGVLTERP